VIGAERRWPRAAGYRAWLECQEVIAQPDGVEAKLLGPLGDAPHLLVLCHNETGDGEGEDEAEAKVGGHVDLPP